MDSESIADAVPARGGGLLWDGTRMHGIGREQVAVRRHGGMAHGGPGGASTHLLPLLQQADAAVD